MNNYRWRKIGYFRYFVKSYLIKPYIFFSIYILATYLSYIFANYDNNPFQYIHIVISVLIFPILVYGFMKIVYFKFNIISKEYLEKIIPINDFLLKETQRVFSLKKYSTDEIIEKSTQIQKHILSLSRIRKYSFWFDTNQKDLVGNYIKETSISMLNILRALQKKL